MSIREWQKKVDDWINNYGVRYFDIMTNTALLMEEVGEMTSLIARIYGEQSFKKEVSKQRQLNRLKEELADTMFVLTCIANQTNIDLTEALNSTIEKKKTRDQYRHLKNTKLREDDK